MIDWLQKFKVVVETKNITKAAERLYISQPALTQSVQNLEKMLGCKLLIRGKNGVTTTKIGDIVYQHSKLISQEVKNLKTKIAEKTNRLENRIKMGMIANVGLIFISRLYKKFLLKFPKLNLNIQVDNSTQLIEQIDSGKLNFAIITKPDSKLPKWIATENFASEKMALVATLQIARGIKKITDIPQYNFISYNKESNTYKIVQNILKNHGIRAKSKIYSASPDFILQMIRLGTGIAVLPRNVVMEDLRINILEEIELPGLSFQRDLSLIYLKSTYLSKTTKIFLEELKNLYHIDERLKTNQ